MLYTPFLIAVCAPIIKADTFATTEGLMQNHSEFNVKWERDVNSARAKTSSGGIVFDDLGLPNLTAMQLSALENRRIIRLNRVFDEKNVIELGVPALFKLQKFFQCSVFKKNSLYGDEPLKQIHCTTLLAIIEMAIRMFSFFAATMWLLLIVVLKSSPDGRGFIDKNDSERGMSKVPPSAQTIARVDSRPRRQGKGETNK